MSQPYPQDLTERNEAEGLTLAEELPEREQLFWPSDYISSVGQEPMPSVPSLKITPETKPVEVLSYYWGYDDFRPMQQEIVSSVLEGHDTLGLLPTGGGKSITFQVPGLMLPGLTLVITPLIALMKDQVMGLRARGIKAEAIHSGMSSSQILTSLDNCLYGRYKFLYISPERLGSEAFRERLVYMDISLLVIDECHCISQWGYDFRPSYLNILEVRELLGSVPVLALTATATPEVASDIAQVLGFGEDARVLSKSFYRPNLSYSIRRVEDKPTMLLHILSRVEGSAVVYCRSREQTRQISQWLESCGVSSNFFHAGLTHLERDMRQKRWMRGEVRVMVATNAFGMGIDKPDVRLVVHMMMPSSLEEYFQEAGRAGRDGERAYAVALVSSRDVSLLRRRLSDAFPERGYIYKTYEALCDYLGIGEGEGYGRTYVCDLEELIRRFRMRPVQTYSALEIMQVSGWLSLDESETRSRLTFLYTRDQLYREALPGEEVLRALMRLYTGLFSDYVFISEEEVAALLQRPILEVCEALAQLSRQGVVHYIPQTHLPHITMHIRREDTKYLHIPPRAYEERQRRMADRIAAVCRYIDREQCRSIQLLHYFGEASEQSCGMCDVCLRRLGDGGLHYYIVHETERALRSLLDRSSGQAVSVGLLVGDLPFEQELILEALRYVVAQREDLALEGDCICSLR